MTIVTTGGTDLTAQGHRNQTSLLLLPGTDPLFAVDGVHSGLDLTKTSGMSFNISTGRAAVNGATASDGAFAVTVTATEAGAFAPGDATRNRIDLVVIRTDGTQSTSLAGQIVVIQGDYPGSGNPVAPTPLPGDLPLWQVPINAGMSAGSGGWNRALAVDVRPSIGITRWNNFTPVWSGYGSLGSGSSTHGRWRRSGDQIAFQAYLTMGTGGTWGASTLRMTLPVSRDSDAYRSMGNCVLVDIPNGSAYYQLAAVVSGQTTCDIYGQAGSNGQFQWLYSGSSYPHSGAQINIDMVYNINASSLG
jgi:hypothetical protein